MSDPSIAVRIDDAGAAHVADLIAYHRRDAHADTPPGYRHSLDAAALCTPAITFWTAWCDDALAGIGALRALGDDTGEVKSMRTAPGYLRRGVARAVVTAIVATARDRGYRRLLLETGTSPSFTAANALYERIGFVDCDAFGDYPPSPHNRFMTLTL